MERRGHQHARQPAPGASPRRGDAGGGARPTCRTVLEDQQPGGLIMWVPAGMVYLAIGLLLFATWLRSLDRPAARMHSTS
jgi:hypothetical protein